MDLDEATDRLYGMAPGEFTGARDTVAKQAKASGDIRLSQPFSGLAAAVLTRTSWPRRPDRGSQGWPGFWTG
ncbi:hypothetical protein GCM10022226_49390 [Sphaerisporangium flaviroseum]|uniref:Uncharacterized protein n=1 Tax=Sphaerisporangium flaviroseum TaxID=509199 RepID=A0ABP7INI8_9ACTN